MLLMLGFEERELFPIAEKCLTKNELDAIYEASAEYVKRINLLQTTFHKSQLSKTKAQSD